MFESDRIQTNYRFVFYSFVGYFTRMSVISTVQSRVINWEEFGRKAVSSIETAFVCRKPAKDLLISSDPIEFPVRCLRSAELPLI